MCLSLTYSLMNFLWNCLKQCYLPQQIVFCSHLNPFILTCLTQEQAWFLLLYPVIFLHLYFYSGRFRILLFLNLLQVCAIENEVESPLSRAFIYSLLFYKAQLFSYSIHLTVSKCYISRRICHHPTYFMPDCLLEKIILLCILHTGYNFMHFFLPYVIKLYNILWGCGLSFKEKNLLLNKRRKCFMKDKK